MIYKPIAVLALTLLAASAASSNNETRSKQDTAADFKSLDRNNDGKISQSEASANSTLADRFAALDTNSDGFLTKREFSAHSKEQPSQRSSDKLPDEKPPIPYEH